MVSASRDPRRISVTREIHRRVSCKEINSEILSCNGNSTPRIKGHPNTQRPVTLKRFFATIPDSSERYIPVPKAYLKAHAKSSWKQRRAAFIEGIKSRLPVIECLFKYNVKDNLTADVISGIAVAALQFPQGMAYGLLAGLTPAIGMVSTIFPMLLYIVFGSAAHTSLGTNSIVSAMIENMFLEPTVQEEINQLRSKSNLLMGNSTMNGKIILTDDMHSEAIMQYKIALAAGVAFFTGLIFLLLALLRMGFLMTYLSQSFMSGFTTGVAVHIFSSQVTTALGLKAKSFGGCGKLIKLYIDIFDNIRDIHIASVTVTIICAAILLLVKILINDKLKPRIPVPIEAIVLVLATVISHVLKMSEKFELQAIGAVKMGILSPRLPSFTPTITLVLCAAEIVLVTFFLNLSVIKIVSRRNGYEVNKNVETNAYALCNIISSFFSNMPASINPPRVTLLSSMGAKTTLSGVSTVGIMFALMLYLGQFFQSCPLAVLASLIMVSTKDLLKQVTVLPNLWKVNKNDFTTWIITALSCILLDIHYGLLFGVLVSLLSVINQSQRGRMSVLGKSDVEDLYLDKKDYGGVREIPGIKIIRMESSLYFATAEKFRKCLYKSIEEDVGIVQKETISKRYYKSDSFKHIETQGENGMQASFVQEKGCVHFNIVEDRNDEGPAIHMRKQSGITNQTNEEILSSTLAGNDESRCIESIDGDMSQSNVDDKDIERKRGKVEGKPFKGYLIIIDCLPINFIDVTGLDMLKLIILELGSIDITIFLARFSRYMLRLLEKSDIYEFFPREHVFLDIPDAVNASVVNRHSGSPFRTTCLEHNCNHKEDVGEANPIRRARLMSLPLSQEMPFDRFLNRTSSLFNQL